MKILYKYTSKSRSNNFFRGLDTIVRKSKSKEYEVLGTFDLDDGSMNNEDVIDRLRPYENLKYFFGHSENKIDAINRDMDLVDDWDILVNMSDDMIFTVDGFDDTIRRAFDCGDRFIHFNDGNQRDNVCTMSIMGRAYYDRFKYIYHPSYESLWCDCEATEVAKLLGRYKYMGHSEVIFRHLHPSFGLSNYDEQYRKTEGMEVRSKDHETFLSRKDKNFDL